MDATNLNTTVTIIAIILTIVGFSGITYLIKTKRTHKQNIKNSFVFGDVTAGDKNEQKDESKN